MSHPSDKDFHQVTSIEELERSLAELRSAVRASNSLLKAVASSYLYPTLSLVLGAASVLYCLWARAAAMDPSRQGPGFWSWIFLAVVIAMGGFGKIFFTSRLASRHGGRGFFSLMTVIYGGKSASLVAGSIAAMVSVIVFLIHIGHPWYIVPLMAIYAGLASHAMDLLIDLAEYRVLGWLSLLAGIVSLFFIEADPLLWTAIVTAAVFVVFGAVGIVRAFTRENIR
ncbi:MAG: hypothetical protein Q8O15_02300 [Rectinemataceae bacterium]|nr:hypothetical protein [Rectinemataceae bacterium]